MFWLVVKNCHSFFFQDAEIEDYLKSLFRGNNSKYESLITRLIEAATVINYKLTSNLKHNGYKNELMEEKSQTTKRNSQYKSVAAQLIWHISYKLAYKEENCIIKEGEFYIDNTKRDTHTKFIDYEKEKNTSTNNYTYEIVTVLYEKMPVITRYIFNNLLDLINTHKCLCFTIKQKIKDNDFDVKETKDQLKRISIEKKLFTALLLELDMHEALLLMKNQLNPQIFKKYPVDEFLKMSINKLCEKRFSTKEVNVNKEALHGQLKDGKRAEVLEQLIIMAKCLKYNEFPMASLPHDYIKNAMELKKYEHTCRNTKSIYFYPSPSILQLTVEITPENYTIVTFVSEISNKTETFDLLGHPNYSYEVLNTMSWQQRLDLCTQLQIKPKPIVVKELKKERIQFNKLPKGNINASVCCYIRTEGFGVGTFYVQTVSNSQTSVRRLAVNRRHKKITPLDTVSATFETFDNFITDNTKTRGKKRSNNSSEETINTKIQHYE